jgi:hypothetical protein
MPITNNAITKRPMLSFIDSLIGQAQLFFLPEEQVEDYYHRYKNYNETHLCCIKMIVDVWNQINI